MKNLFLAILIVTGMSSCLKEVDTSFLESQQKAVVQSFLNPADSLVSVSLTNSISFFGTQDIDQLNVAIRNAQITISNNAGFSQKLFFNAKTGYYESVFKIIEGKTYFLNVILPNGEKLSSSCVVPNSIIDSNNIKIVSNKKTENIFDVQASWNGSNLSKKQIVLLYTYRQNYIDPSRIDKSNEQGQFLEVEGKDKITSMVFITTVFNDLNKRTLFVMNVDDNYFKFYKSAQNNVKASQDPFAEPALVYSNIQGGLGIFGAFQSKRVDFNLQ